MHKETLKDIGEKELIRRISLFMPVNQTKDDCALFKVKKSNILINTDLMVEDTHFNKYIMTPHDIGWKATTTNISDLISSGCDEIIGITIGLVLSPNTNWEWVENLYKGINEALQSYGGSILGGDCTRGSKNMVSISALGTQGEINLRRYACKPNEILLTSGVHGLSKLGLLLKNKEIKDDQIFPDSLIIKALETFSRPKPKVEILKNIIKSRNKYDKKKIGCTDTSDGLYQAALDLATSSNCSVIIDYKKLPKEIGWPEGPQWDNYYFFGGEDYELLFSLPEKWAKRLQKENKNIREIGLITRGQPQVKIKNKEYELNTNSYSHF